MTEVYRRMLNDDEYDSPEKCRERRRRRIEMRRLAAGGSPQPINPQISKEKNQAAGGESSSSASTEGKRVVEMACGFPVAEPVFGSMSVSGRSREMEDAVSVRINFFQPEVNRRRPVHLFGVFDGHGGAHVAALCRERMHVLIEEELARVDVTRLRSESGDGGAEWEEMWRGVMKRSYERMDEVAMGTCACGSMGFKCGCHPMQMALGGSTAVVAVLSPEHIIVANCGDSRAALSRGGRAIPLSVDHKPDRSDELARIEAAGGRVIFLNGARVEGILAMSRAIDLDVHPCRMSHFMALNSLVLIFSNFTNENNR
ncbi:PROTEIN PHOSPHATASE 2C 75-RELATED [Salix koriyanagi]|uniref:protein-serine/threonine phosphatase n=1 Tax=Salix koriyanagi TaxID=2511006 RepID=A0A9Q0WDJ7_9ROSI|nr:PROTEIN PHOSPHATASE 2C 75-RELATED [Salix koriyanagi]